MALNDVKCEATSSVKAEVAADDTHANVKLEENKDSIKAAVTSAVVVEAEAFREDQKTHGMKQENDYIQAKKSSKWSEKRGRKHEKR
ncbi:unnamed protein product [Peronospora belbahrii]|uniref:Uncharacterized protein n=1 Tax=Peronospora belbahrii TaxID=622444 RepID=A0AAU9KP06_9STRA|nr:unnamed protein product [Peronospora belbahrii]